MLVLAFDTATPAVTVALHDGRRTLAESTVIDARRHGELLMPGVSAVLGDAGVAREEITHIAVGTGPGPYTGLRVGLMTAQALATALGVSSYGVCTLDVLAYESGLTGPFLVATDARRKEVFWAEYAGQRTRVRGPAVDRPGDVPGDLPILGYGAKLYPEAVGAARIVAGAPEHPSAAALAALAAEEIAAGRTAGAVLTDPRPIYLRRPDAKIPGPPKKVTVL
ncbi:tRNA (adenosine(37)-N6)-threonylcarbamoyltransferase complex dimerization subunit type 1 TsaB [Rhizohabitans arisaemae]|uniref:tRNA (adenosine(37)-N6)-threonylcarbamoyltransferase complex dimerization subunit type 1 TsaB n=1 Tax=Rhizohabitans arisaemae TaxID=2720610 RepID=UPI0024B0E759|nr:tRNA (adenosine(37)-N6)-threonylcarbamoyltransferase complex dimerization subunit type 1 TsaB [Rhizohabitans arisaemae]